MCAVSHSQEQHHQTAGRKPAAEEWKQPYSDEGTTTIRGTLSHVHICICACCICSFVKVFATAKTESVDLALTFQPFLSALITNWRNRSMIWLTCSSRWYFSSRLPKAMCQWSETHTNSRVRVWMRCTTRLEGNWRRSVSSDRSDCDCLCGCITYIM